MPSTSVIGIVKIVSHISEYFCGAYLLEVTCKEIATPLEVLLVRDTATDKKTPNNTIVFTIVFTIVKRVRVIFSQLQLCILYELYLRVNFCSLQSALTWYQAQCSQ